MTGKVTQEIVHTWKQPGGWECGCFTRNQIEDELRAQRGEGSFASRMQLNDAFFEWLQGIVDLFRSVVPDDAFEDGLGFGR